MVYFLHASSGGAPAVVPWEWLLLLLYEGEIAERAHVFLAQRLQRKVGQVTPAVAQDATVRVNGLHR